MSDKPVLALIVAAAPPALRIAELIDLLISGGWTVCVTATPTAATWIDREALARQTGYPVRVEWRQPGDPEPHPAADVVVVAPATFNVMNKWALGLNDNVALGILNQALGAGLPIYAFPNVNAQLARHPAHNSSSQLLAINGVNITPFLAEFDWQAVVHAVQEGRGAMGN
ncbi:flavoprotein [Micromonospora sp. RL09-050-HVF-A]|uniref:flavoprotein n=1 Tax=Micromonospora sp. RL09-050-HVF-A TaxID=1703433 RepID=UPI001C5D1F17|nr:flavoprotein [Micromonospora sp. RL09-050-HVF-A]MBW4702426.1 flavoprotein [Micromonospora sp. RL09-050-HVF-A]